MFHFINQTFTRFLGIVALLLVVGLPSSGDNASATVGVEIRLQGLFAYEAHWDPETKDELKSRLAAALKDHLPWDFRSGEGERYTILFVIANTEVTGVYAYVLLMVDGDEKDEKKIDLKPEGSESILSHDRVSTADVHLQDALRDSSDRIKDELLKRLELLDPKEVRGTLTRLKGLLTEENIPIVDGARWELHKSDAYISLRVARSQYENPELAFERFRIECKKEYRYHNYDFSEPSEVRACGSNIWMVDSQSLGEELYLLARPMELRSGRICNATIKNMTLDELRDHQLSRVFLAGLEFDTLCGRAYVCGPQRVPH